MVTKIWILLLFAQVYSLCSLRQNCVQAPYDCGTPFSVNPPSPAFQANFTAPYACPMFLGQEVCCNQDQNEAMNYKFFLLDETFGHSVGGCDICAANLKNLWCHFTCHPLQSQYVKTGEQKYVPSPVEPTQLVLALLTNFTVTNSLACEIYQSCQKCPYVTEVSAMQSPQGFLEFQGYEGIPIGLVWTTFYFSDGSDALDLEILPCNSNVTSAYGYQVQSCSCNNCLNQCQANYLVAAPSTLEGIDWFIVGVVYLTVLVFTMTLFFSKYAWLKGKKCLVRKDEEESNDAYHLKSDFAH